MTNIEVGWPRVFASGFDIAVKSVNSDVTIVDSQIAPANHAINSYSFPTLPPITINPGTGILAIGSTLHLSRTDVEGGAGNSGSMFPVGKPAIDAQSSNVTVTGLADNFFRVGTSFSPVPAITTANSPLPSTVLLDSDLILQGAGGSPPVTGGGITQRVVVSLDAGGGDLGGFIGTNAASQANDIVLIVLGVPVPPNPMPPYGTARIGLANVFLITSAVQPASGLTADVVVVPNVAFLRGLTLGIQALNWDHVSGAVEWSNVVDVVVH